MEYLMNGAFYSFLISQCTISFEHVWTNFDWIPVQVRMQLVMLLDAWKAAQMRLTWIQSKPTDFSPDVIAHASQEEAEHRRFFELELKKAYQTAERLAHTNWLHGIDKAPVPDLEFWRQVCNRELYEARLAAGEPVVFYEGRCCLYGGLDGSCTEYRNTLYPGPYPGLQYYHFFDNAYTSSEGDFWKMAQSERNSDRKMQKKPIPMGFMAIPCHVKRQRLLKKCNIIGPATYAEFVNQHGLTCTIELTEEHRAYQEAYEASIRNWRNVASAM